MLSGPIQRSGPGILDSSEQPEVSQPKNKHESSPGHDPAMALLSSYRLTPGSTSL